MRQENTSSRALDNKTSLIILAGALMLLAAILMLTSGPAMAISASPDPVMVKQPDGTSITLFLKGDEYFHWNEDETGFPVVRSADNRTWVYAIEQLGQLAPTAVAAGSVNPLLAGLPKPDIARMRTEALKSSRPMLESNDGPIKAPAATTMYNLVLLVNYSDLAITSTRQEFDDLFNEVGHTADGATGSVKDYYDEVSYGELDVVSIVVEPVTISNGYAYYGANSGGFDIRPREMVAEGLAALEARGFDFSSVDGDNDGWIDGLTVIHAGGGEEYSGNDPDYIWSHQWALSYTVTYDGTRMRQYHTEPARRGYDSSPSSWGITRIGVICHETGHFLGLPDFYDYGYDSRGAGNFCLMAGGSWGNGGITPVHMNAACKYWLGWVTPTEITTGGLYSISQIETNQSMYLMQGPFASTEYFLVENRQGVGFDVSLPGSERGLLIWHIDETISNNDDQTHYQCDLEEASGVQHLELDINGGDDFDYFRANNLSEFTSLTTPNNLNYTGTPLGLDMRLVSGSSSVMSFVINGMSLEVTAPAVAEVVDVGDVYRVEWTVTGDTPDSVSVLLSIDSGASYPDTVGRGIVAVDYYDWTVPNLPVPTARLKVIAYTGGALAGFDETDGDFTISGAPYRYVSVTGGNIYPYSLPAWAAHTIADAVGAAVDGDSIMVAADTYSEQVSVHNDVYLLGGWNSAFTVNDPVTNVTTISSGGSSVSFLTIPGGTPGVEGFTITGGSGTSTLMPGTGIYGGGVFVYSSPALIKNNIITGAGYTSTTGYSAGGGIACYDGTVTIEGNEITGCIAQSGGGIYLYQATATITGNTISGSSPNVEFTGEKKGGGIYALHSGMTLSGNTISGNTGYADGGGIYANLSPFTSDGDSIFGNDITSTGGGIYSLHSDLEMTHGFVQGNTAGSSGGGIYQRAAQFDISNSIVAQNSASNIGGGVNADSTWGSWYNNTVDRNMAGTVGGNVFLSPAAMTYVYNNIFSYSSTDGFTAASDVNLEFTYNNGFGNSGVDFNNFTPDATNISSDPAYADTTALDYYLALHSGSVDAGHVLGLDPDGSRVDQGAYGNPDAIFMAPDYVTNLVAAVTNDTTITISWDGVTPEGGDYFAIYSDTASGFVPAESNYIGMVDASLSTFQHHPVAGCHYYRVSHVDSDGYMGGFSNEAGECTAGLDLVAPTVTVVYPNGGEAFEPGDFIDIQWVATDNNAVDSISIFYSENNGTDFTLIVSSEPNDSTYQWTAPDISSDSCIVRVVAYDPALLTGEDVSDAIFTIVSIDDEQPAVTVVYPNGGEAFEPGDFIDIQWVATDNNAVDSISIFYSENNGTDFTLVASSEPNDSTYQWTAPDISSDSCLVRVVAYDPALLTGEDVSDAIFTIKIVSTDDELPAATWALSQNFPNPFNPTTTIHYDVKAGGGQVSLRVFDVSGRVVRTLVNGHQTAGTKSITWNGTNDAGQRVASGIYFYRMIAPDFTQTKKMVLLR